MLQFGPERDSPTNLYKLMIGMVVPRPIAFVSSLDSQGIRNLAPFSYFMACSADPPVVCFVASHRSGPRPAKDTLTNILATKEFVVNIVSEEFAAKMNLTSAEVPPEVDEFELSGLTPLDSDLVKPPRVAESHVHMECRLRQTLPISNATGAATTIIFGDVLRFHVAEAIVDNYRIDPAKLRAIGRMGGPYYIYTHDLFEMARPK
ncbi:MAG TPA: flavin reductase family protein [Acidobacteriaceae bacterium]|nr:flavin reductase family protein [Acidobacteriaceae bacterium]